MNWAAIIIEFIKMAGEIAKEALKKQKEKTGLTASETKKVLMKDAAKLSLERAAAQSGFKKLSRQEFRKLTVEQKREYLKKYIEWKKKKPLGPGAVAAKKKLDLLERAEKDPDGEVADWRDVEEIQKAANWLASITGQKAHSESLTTESEGGSTQKWATSPNNIRLSQIYMPIESDYFAYQPPIGSAKEPGFFVCDPANLGYVEKCWITDSGDLLELPINRWEDADFSAKAGYIGSLVAALSYYGSTYYRSIPAVIDTIWAAGMETGAQLDNMTVAAAECLRVIQDQGKLAYPYSIHAGKAYLVGAMAANSDRYGVTVEKVEPKPGIDVSEYFLTDTEFIFT